MQTTQPIFQPIFDIKSIAQRWSALESFAPLRVIHNDTDYENMVNLLNGLLDAVGDDETQPLASLLELVGEIVADYEAKKFEIPKEEPKEVLRFMMETKNTSQVDLASVVPQSNLSAILAGKRKISPKVAKGLGDFFGISPLAFLTLT